MRVRVGVVRVRVNPSASITYNHRHPVLSWCLQISPAATRRASRIECHTRCNDNLGPSHTTNVTPRLNAREPAEALPEISGTQMFPPPPSWRSGRLGNSAPSREDDSRTTMRSALCDNSTKSRGCRTRLCTRRRYGTNRRSAWAISCDGGAGASRIELGPSSHKMEHCRHSEYGIH
ncbi:hypothetical protein B0H12DRAFT_207046 [Mycena haematopus]|nr:hypothetical protein B0H12DRAFT_207046 [Mycena haematopus]